MPRRHFSLQFSLTTAFCLAVAFSCFILGAETYISVRTFLRDGMRDRLDDAVRLAALSLDAEAHAKLSSAADEPTDAYRAFQHRLAQIRERTRNIRFVYTIRKGTDGRIRFVVDAAEGKDHSPLGEVYEPKNDVMLAAFQAPYRSLVEQRFYEDKWGSTLSGYAPLLKKDGTLDAVLGMDVGADEELAYEWRYLMVVVLAALAVCTGGVGLGMMFSGMLSRPLIELTRDLARVRNLDLDSHPATHSAISEVMQMTEAVEHMKSGLRSFRKYVPSDLVMQLIRLGQEAVLGAEKREMTLFFSDIENFTTLSEELTPEMLSVRLADYLKGMTRTLLEHHATVDKFIGDAVMAFWGAPAPSPDHAVRACQAALACQRFIASLGGAWEGGPKTPFITRIGIHSGEALVGNIGFEERLSYTAIGDTVNTASRLEGLNKYYGTYLMVSGVTKAAVGDRFVTRQLDVVIVKGKTRGLAVHELLGERGQVPPERVAFAERHDRGFALYSTRKFAEARELFLAALEEQPHDRPSQLMRERCEAFLAEPPPADWDGATHMHSK